MELRVFHNLYTSSSFERVHAAARHTQSWAEVHKFVEEKLKVWSVKQQQSVLPTLLPWIEKTLGSLTYMRADHEEGTILWINLPCCGVVGTMKKDYFLALITGLMAAKPVNTACVVMHANRASEGKTKRCNSQLWYFFRGMQHDEISLFQFFCSHNLIKLSLR